MVNNNWSFDVSNQARKPFEAADVCLKNNDRMGAIKFLTEVISIEKHTKAAAYAFVQRGNILLQLGNYTQAIGDTSEAIKLSLDDNISAMAYDIRAKARGQSGDINGAISDISQIIQVFPNSPDIYNERGLYRMSNEQYGEAITDFSYAINLTPQNYVFYLNRGQALQGLSHYEAALTDFNKAVNLEPLDGDNFYYRGMLLFLTRNLDAALVDMNEAIRLNPVEPYHFSNRAEIYFQKGMFDQAIVDFKRAIEFNPPDTTQIRYKLAEVYAQRSLKFNFAEFNEKYGFKEALVDAENAIKLYPSSVMGYFARANAYYGEDSAHITAKDITEWGKKAIADFTQVIKMAPDAARAYGGRAMIYMKYSYLNEAFRDFKSALKLQPDQPFQSPWVVGIQMIVNALAKDGYNLSAMSSPVFGMPEYHEVVKGPINDWDHYLQWRLNKKQVNNNAGANRSIHDWGIKFVPNIQNESDIKSSKIQEKMIDAKESDRYQKIGLTHKRQGNYVSSKQAYYKAIELNYTDTMAYFALGKTCYLAGDAREAILNYLSSLHVSIIYMIQSLTSAQDYSSIMRTRQALEEQFDPIALKTIREIHPYADLLYQDMNTSRHLGHVIVDLNTKFKQSDKLRNHIQLYQKSMQGDQSVIVDQAIENTYYLGIGRLFALDNIKWKSIGNLEPYSIYRLEDSLNFTLIRNVINNQPK